MKKLYILAILILFSGALKAQTKEETIAWLKEKLEKHVSTSKRLGLTYDSLKLVSVTECEITVSYIFFNYHYQITIPTDVDSFEGDEFSFKTYKVKKEVYLEKKEGADLKLQTESDPIILANNEDDLQNQVLKALKHLHTFCTQKIE